MRRALFVALAAALLLGACSSGKASTASSTAEHAGPPTSFVSLGGRATEGDGVRDRLHNAWPYLVFHHALPEATQFVNMATDDGRAAIAITEQVPLASDLKPDIAALWIGPDDVRAQTPVSEFQFAFGRVVDDLRAAGAQRVLVGTIPKAFGNVDPYNAVIRAVARSSHAEVVELENANIHLQAVNGLPPQPDTASHRVIADAFARVISAKP